MRDDRPEKERYARASLREQLGGELAALRRNPPLIWLLAAVVGGWLVLTVTRPQALEADAITAGDCLYIRAADADTDTPTGRQIGSDGAVVSALYEAGAEGAPCGGSHSHEVAAAFRIEGNAGTPYPGQGVLVEEARDRCEAAFPAHVGRPAEGSTFALVVAVPTPGAWDDGARGAACLVARRDGRFLLSPAQGSGQ